jgi:hypothetical protein
MTKARIFAGLMLVGMASVPLIPTPESSPDREDPIQVGYVTNSRHFPEVAL